MLKKRHKIKNTSKHTIFSFLLNEELLDLFQILQSHVKKKELCNQKRLLIFTVDFLFRLTIFHPFLNSKDNASEIESALNVSAICSSFSGNGSKPQKQREKIF